MFTLDRQPAVPSTTQARKGQHHHDVLAPNRDGCHSRELVRRDEHKGENERLAILALRLSTLTFLAVVILTQVHG